MGARVPARDQGSALGGHRCLGFAMKFGLFGPLSPPTASETSSFAISWMRRRSFTTIQPVFTASLPLRRRRYARPGVR